MKHGILIIALTFSVGVYAEEWVSVGAGGTVAAPAATSNYVDTSQQAQLSSPRVSGGNTLLSELAMQVEQMQQEIALLRGQLEQQEFQFKQLQQEQQQRYLDVDRRLSALVMPVESTVSPAKSDTQTDESAEATYQEAMGLIKAKKFAEAQTQFARLIKNYPKDPLIGNALYWSAEVWLVQAEPDKALVEFKKVVNSHPEHSKAADAAYKIGVTLDRQGKSKEAKEWLQKVINDYTGKADTTVRLAQSYLEKM